MRDVEVFYYLAALLFNILPLHEFRATEAEHMAPPSATVFSSVWRHCSLSRHWCYTWAAMTTRMGPSASHAIGASLVENVAGGVPGRRQRGWAAAKLRGLDRRRNGPAGPWRSDDGAKEGKRECY